MPQKFETIADGNVYFRIIKAQTQTRQILPAHFDNAIVDVHQRDALYIRMFCDFSGGPTIATSDYQNLLFGKNFELSVFS